MFGFEIEPLDELGNEMTGEHRARTGIQPVGHLLREKTGDGLNVRDIEINAVSFGATLDELRVIM
jgi:hypothetical protein